jgi:two-component system CheB/CheR fusion protein
MKPASGIAERICQQSPDALLLVDAKGRIAYVNEAVTALFGYPDSELLGQAIEMLVPVSARGVHERYRQGFSSAPAIREMGARIVALTARRRDGTEFPAEIRLAPVHVDPGDAGKGDSDAGDFVLAAVRDVTDRRRLTDELRAARVEADSANKAKSRFLATASHDLRQPLQTLQLLNAALARRLADSTNQDLVQRQQSALESMADLLNALLDVTKLESGALKPNMAVVPLADVLADLKGQFQDMASAQGLTVQMPETTECLRTDRVLFRQLLQNLLTNAMQYTRVGGVTVTAQREPDGLMIRVTDTGVGIPDTEINRVFDEYYRVDMPGNRPRGFGLGLTIVRQIGRLLGLGVQVESELGRGTTFVVQIPSAQLVAATPGWAIQPGLAPERPDVPKPAVLVIEDDAAVRDALELLLSLDGYPTRVADSAAAAEEIFALHGAEIDLVISDFQLGNGRNGLEVLEKLRAEAGRDLPAVILSGDTSPVFASIQTVPRVVVLRKPVNARQLIVKLEKLFGEAV